MINNCTATGIAFLALMCNLFQASYAQDASIRFLQEDPPGIAGVRCLAIEPSCFTASEWLKSFCDESSTFKASEFSCSQARKESQQTP